MLGKCGRLWIRRMRLRWPEQRRQRPGESTPEGSDPAQPHVCPESAVGGTALYRGHRLAVDHQHSNVAAVALRDVLLKDEIRAWLGTIQQTGEVVELLSIRAKQDSLAACPLKRLAAHGESQTRAPPAPRRPEICPGS